MFDEVKRARDVLRDEEARAKFDAVLRSRAARAERDMTRTTKQREMMDKLLAGEAANKKQREAERVAKHQLDAELERLRNEMRQHELARAERSRKRANDASVLAAYQRAAAQTTIRVSWSDKEGDLTEAFLSVIFKDYGDIEHILIGKRKRDAVISYASIDSAVKFSKLVLFNKTT